MGRRGARAVCVDLLKIPHIRLVETLTLKLANYRILILTGGRLGGVVIGRCDVQYVTNPL